MGEIHVFYDVESTLRVPNKEAVDGMWYVSIDVDGFVSVWAETKAWYEVEKELERLAAVATEGRLVVIRRGEYEGPPTRYEIAPGVYKEEGASRYGYVAEFPSGYVYSDGNWAEEGDG